MYFALKTWVHNMKWPIMKSHRLATFTGEPDRSAPLGPACASPEHPVNATPPLRLHRQHSDQTRQQMHAVQSAHASGPSLKSSLGSASKWPNDVLLHAARVRRTAKVEAWPHRKVTSAPADLAKARPGWRRQRRGEVGGIHDVGFAGETVGCVWDVSL